MITASEMFSHKSVWVILDERNPIFGALSFSQIVINILHFIGWVTLSGPCLIHLQGFLFRWHSTLDKYDRRDCLEASTETGNILVVGVRINISKK